MDRRSALFVSRRESRPRTLEVREERDVDAINVGVDREDVISSPPRPRPFLFSYPRYLPWNCSTGLRTRKYGTRKPGPDFGYVFSTRDIYVLSQDVSFTTGWRYCRYYFHS